MDSGMPEVLCRKEWCGDYPVQDLVRPFAFVRGPSVGWQKTRSQKHEEN